MKYLAATLIAIPLGFAAFLAWPVDYDGQAAGVMRVAVFDPWVELAAIVGFAILAAGLTLVSVGRLARPSARAG